MKSLHDGTDKVPTGHLLSPNSFQYQVWIISNWVVGQKGSQRNPYTTQAIAKTVGCSPKTDNKVPLLR